MICQTSGIVLAINALTPFEASTCSLMPSAALCASSQLDCNLHLVHRVMSIAHLPSSLITPYLLQSCHYRLELDDYSLLTCALNPIPLLSVSPVTLSQFSLNRLLSTIKAGVRSVLMFLPTNSLVKASLDGRVRRERGVVVCIVVCFLSSIFG